MAKKRELDMDGFEEAKVTKEDLKADYGTFRDLQRKCEAAYFMEWEGKPTGEQIRLTLDPAPHNKVTNAVRLLTATSPMFEIPAEKNDPDAKSKSSQLETLSNTMWKRSNSVQGIQVERELGHCGFIHGEMHLRVISMDDLVTRTESALTKLNKKVDVQGYVYKKARLEAELESLKITAERCPFLFEPINPMGVYFYRSRTGLEVHCQEIEMRVSQILEDWPEARNIIPESKGHQKETVSIVETLSGVYVWVGNGKEPIYAGPRDAAGRLNFIPIAVYIPEGSVIYDKPEQSRSPFLYSVIKSGVWERSNSWLTAFGTNLFALAQAQFVLSRTSPDDHLELNLTELGKVIELPPGASLSMLSKEVIDRSMIEMRSILDGLIEDSTIYSQAFGDKVGSNSPYALVALLAQAGRLPLVGVQKGLAEITGAAMNIALRWMKAQGKAARITKDTSKIVEIQASEIPSNVEFSVIVDVDLPQDKLQQANVAASLAAGPDPLTSKSWARTKILNIGQPDEMQKEIWKEKSAEAAMQLIAPMVLKMLAGGPAGGDPAGMDPNAAGAGGGAAMPPGMNQQPPTSPAGMGAGDQSMPPVEPAGGLPVGMPPGMGG